MKTKIESIVYYPVFAVKMVSAVVSAYVGGFINGLRNGSK